MMMDDFAKVAWIAETKRLFEALVVEQRMVMEDTEALQRRVMLACEGTVDPTPPEPAYVPPVIGITARAAKVKEG